MQSQSQIRGSPQRPRSALCTLLSSDPDCKWFMYQQTMPELKKFSALGQHRNGAQAGVFGQAEHEVHVLHRLTGRAFYKVVLHHQHH